MLLSQGSPQDVENARVALVFIAAGVMIFWRYLLRIVVAMLVVAVGVGAFVLLQGMHQ
jgi:hypothetical protein